MKDVFVQQPRVSEPGTVPGRKWKLAKERPAHISFFPFNIKYVFYICEKIGKKYHIVISNISAECTIVQNRIRCLAVNWTEIFVLTKYVIDNQTITVYGARSDIRIATVIYTLESFARKWMYF